MSSGAPKKVCFIAIGQDSQILAIVGSWNLSWYWGMQVLQHPTGSLSLAWNGVDLGSSKIMTRKENKGGLK
jgi:hypothetical protein